MAKEKQEFTTIVTSEARLSFCDTLYEPEIKVKDGKRFETYQCALLFPLTGGAPARAGETDLRGLKIAALNHVKVEKPDVFEALKKTMVEQWPNMPEKISGKGFMFGQPFRNGDTKDWDGYAGTIFIRVKTNRAPGLFVGKRVAEPNEIYAGCYVRASLFPSIYAAVDGGAPGVRFVLKSLQFLRDGEPFTGTGNRVEDFPALPEDTSTPASSDDDLAGV